MSTLHPRKGHSPSIFGDKDSNECNNNNDNSLKDGLENKTNDCSKSNIPSQQIICDISPKEMDEILHGEYTHDLIENMAYNNEEKIDCSRLYITINQWWPDDINKFPNKRSIGNYYTYINNPSWVSNIYIYHN